MVIIILEKIKFKKRFLNGQILKKKKKIKLHMVGKLQTNKAKDAVKLFDYVHSLDSQKLADILSKIRKI